MEFFKRFRNRLSCFAALFVVLNILVGCGGGSSSPQVSVTLPPTLDIAAPPDSTLRTSVTARFHSLPAETIYPVIVGNQRFFISGATFVDRNADGSYTASIGLSTAGLSPGKYSGTLTLKLCKDPVCRTEVELTGGSMQVNLEVVAKIGVTVNVNGLQVARPSAPGASIDLHQGDTVTMVTDQASTWNLVTETGVVSDTASTPTTWSSKAIWSSKTKGYSGSFYVNIASVAHPLNTDQVIFLIIN